MKPRPHGKFGLSSRLVSPAALCLLLFGPLLSGSLQAQSFSPVPALSFVKPFAGADPLPQIVTITSASGANFDFTHAATTNSGGNWLSTAAVGFNCCTTPRVLTVSVATTAGMMAGVYTGQVKVTDFSNSAIFMTIPVTLTVESAGGTFFDNLPGQVSFTMKTGGAAVTSQDLQIRNAGSGTLTWGLSKSTSDGGDWLTLSATSGTAPSLVTVGVAVSNLPGGGSVAGTFLGMLVLSQGAGGSVTIPVSVTVGANVFSQVNAINFTRVFGGADPLPQILTIATTGTNLNFDRNVYNAAGGNWLSVSAVGFNCCTTPRELTAVITTSPSLPVGTYTAQIVVTAEGNGSMALTIPVTLTVEPPGGTFFDSLPGQLTFSMKTGGTSIAGQSLQIRNAGTGLLNWTLAANTSETANWLTVSSASGTAPSPVTVGIAIASLPGGGLVQGHFVGELVLSQPAGGRVTIPVSVVVGDNVFTQINGINFTKVFGGADPLPQTLMVPSTGTNFNFDTNWYTSSGGNWLSVTFTGFNCCTTPRALTAIVTASPSLPAGTYTGEIVVTAEGNGSMAITIPVTLTVEPPGGVFFDNLPGQLSFSMKTGGTKITSQEFQVRNGGSGTLSFSITGQTADTANWLTVSPASGAAPSYVSVGINPANLPGGGLVAGAFIGQLVLSQANGGTATIPVSVVVGLNIFTQINGISFTKVFSGADPLPQILTIPSTGTNFNFDINTYTATGGNWLSVTVVGFNCCTTPRALTAKVTTIPTMPAGTYTGEIVVTAEGNGSMAMTVPVTLTVEPAADTFLDDMQGQMSFSFVAGSGNPAAQTVQVRKRGPLPLGWTLTTSTADGGNWLSPSATSGTAPANVTVGVVSSALPSGGLVAGTFAGELVFRSANSTTTIPVSVTVGPNVFVQLPTVTFTKPFGGANPVSQDLNIASTGTNFNFDHFWFTANGGNWLSVTVAGFNCCTTPRLITANIIATPSLAAGTYTGQIVATVEGNGSSATTIPVILVVQPNSTITSVNPSTGQPGQSIGSVAITGQNTSFVQGVSAADFGPGIVVNSLTVNSATSATANITVQSSAAVGGHDVTVTTGGEVATLAGGFTVVCAYTVTPPGPYIYDAAAQSAMVTVTAGTNCPWGYTSPAPWITFTPSGQTLSGNDTVTANVAANGSGAARSATITVAGASITITQQQTVQVFADVPPTHFSFDAVNLMLSHSITAGCGASPPRYCPDNNVTRGEMAIFIVRAVTGGDTFTYTTTPYFTDVPATYPYFKWIQKMRDLSFTAGCGVSTYCPDDPVTRGQMSVFIIRARLGAAADSTFTYPPTASFTDVPPSYLFFKWIQRMKLDQITAGCGVGTYCPDDPVTRGQMAIFIMRGEFNLLLPPGTPLLTGASPNSATLGQVLTVNLTGTNTSFTQGVTQVLAGPDITVGTVTVTNSTTLSVQLTVGVTATPGPRTLIAKTNTEEAVLPNGFTVN